jgi:hypothetical protein
MMQLLALFALLFCLHGAAKGAGGTAGANCELTDNEKVDCGQMGIDQAGCEAKGCCWRPVLDAAVANNTFYTGKLIDCT